MEKGPASAEPTFAGYDRSFLPYTGLLSVGSWVEITCTPFASYLSCGRHDSCLLSHAFLWAIGFHPTLLFSSRSPTSNRSFSACCLCVLAPLPGLLLSDHFLLPGLRVLQGLLAVGPVLLSTLLASGLARDGRFLFAFGAEAVPLGFVSTVLLPGPPVFLPLGGLATGPVVLLGIGLRSRRCVRLCLIAFLRMGFGFPVRPSCTVVLFRL